MAKRPSGFGKASKLKKRKSEDAPDSAAGALNKEPEVNIELQDETTDDELAEVYGLYAKLREERDPRIARGLVHEADQLLRSRDAKDEALPAKFHVAYGAALLTLADPEVGEKEEHSKFGEAGVERLQVGLDATEDLSPEVRALAAAELIQYAHTQLADGSIGQANRKLVKQARKLLEGEDTHAELACAAISLLQLADDCGDEMHLSETAKRILERQATSPDAETKRLAHEGLGQFYLNAVEPALDALEDEGEDEDGEASGNDEDNAANERVKSDLKTALDYLQLAATESKPSTLVILAETLLQWSNFVNEEEAEEVYAKALAHLKKAQMLGVDTVREIIESLENPEEESD